jgi:hypothetical protein
LFDYSNQMVELGGVWSEYRAESPLLSGFACLSVLTPSSINKIRVSNISVFEERTNCETRRGTYCYHYAYFAAPSREDERLLR